jgi:hypothetical protein
VRVRATSDDAPVAARDDRGMNATRNRTHDRLDAAVYLAGRRRAIVDAAETALAARAPRYVRPSTESARDRLDLLYGRLIDVLAGGSPQPLLEHARHVADSRFHGGYGLGDVQAAYNACEEAIWNRVLADGDLERYAIVLPFVSSALGAAKDELAREYVKLATGARVPALDVTALFEGLERP